MDPEIPEGQQYQNIKESASRHFKQFDAQPRKSKTCASRVGSARRFAFAGCSAAFAFDACTPPTTEPPRERKGHLSALPPLAIGCAGLAAVVQRHGRLSWRSHTYESWAWGIAYGIYMCRRHVG